MTEASKTLCGTCRWWDHERAEQHNRKYPGLPHHRISVCRWGQDFRFPEWCDGLRGDRFTNEAGVTAHGCPAWEDRSGETPT